MTPEQQRTAIDAAAQEIVDTRRKLRTVQFDLNRDISRLENELRVFDIVPVPAVLTVLAIVLGLVRTPSRARARANRMKPRTASHPGRCSASLPSAGGWYFGIGTSRPANARPMAPAS